jgi:type I restriction enzyme S subunit
LPRRIEQQQIADYLDKKCEEIDRVVEIQKDIIEKLKEYKQSVITEAVTRGLDKSVPLKDSGIEWIGKIPEHWGIIKLKYLSLSIGDGIHSTPNYDDFGDIYFINGNNIGKDNLIFKDDTKKINKTEFANYNKPILNENTVLITLNGATYGKTSFYNGENVLLGKSAGYITLNKDQNKKYIRYYLQSNIAKFIMDLSLSGTTIANLSLTTLNYFIITYASIKEQQQIVDYLDKKCSEINSAISDKEKLIEKFTEYKKSLIYECVTGKRKVVRLD